MKPLHYQIRNHLTIFTRDIAHQLYNLGFVPDAWWWDETIRGKKLHMSMTRKFSDGVEINVSESKNLTFYVRVNKHRIAIRWNRWFKTIPDTMSYVHAMIGLQAIDEINELQQYKE